MKTKSEAAKKVAGAKAGAKGAPAKPSAPPTVDPATGIRLDKVKPAVVDRYLKALGLPAEGPIGDRLKRLVDFLMSRVDKKRRSVCGTCEGRSDARFMACPYCGDEESDQKADEDAALAELRGAAPLPLSSAAPATAARAAKDKAPKAEGHAVDAAAGGEAPGVGSHRALATAALGEKAPASGAVEVEAELIVGAPDAPAEPAPARTTADLDESVGRMHRLHEDAMGSVYDLGKELWRCFSEKLWLRRLAPASGEPVYESWTAFVATELEHVCTVQYSYTLMRVSRAFPRELVAKGGMIKKLALLLRVTDPTLQKELEGKLEQGMTIRELQAKVVEAVDEGKAATARPTIEGGRGFRGSPNVEGRLPEPPSPDVEEPGSAAPSSEITEQDLEEVANDGLDDPRLREREPKAGKKGAAAPPPPPPPVAAKGKAPAAAPAQPKVFTLTAEYGRAKFAAQARVPKSAKPKQAKRLADDPWFEEELPNGTRLLIKVVAGKKGLEFVREFLPAKA